MHSQVRRRSVLMDGVPTRLRAISHSVAHTNMLRLDDTTAGASDTDDDIEQDEAPTSSPPEAFLQYPTGSV